MKRLIGFIVLGSAVAVLVARRLLRRTEVAQPPAEGAEFDAEAKARAHHALRERLARIPIAGKPVH